MSREDIHAAATAGVTDDTLVGGRVRIYQPSRGYRVAIDPVLLAAAVPARTEQTVLDVGAGAGAAALCLAVRVDEVRVRGLEVDPDLARLARRNVRANGLDGRVDVIAGDLLDAPPIFVPGSFDHVMVNPPYQEPSRGRPSPDAAKAAAVMEGTAVLGDWLDFCVRMVRPKGTLTLIHRADRLDAVLARLHDALGALVVFPLWPGPAAAGSIGVKPAKRVIVQGRKGAATPLRLSPGLVLHDAVGAFTAAADEILRHGRALDLRPGRVP